jgi:hypothetical protein
MLNLNRAWKGWLLILCISLSSCTTFPTHRVDRERLDAVKDRPTKVGSVAVPCVVENGITIGGTLIQEDQVAMLDNIDTSRILEVLHRRYGLKIDGNDALELKSSFRHWMAILSKSRGRCFYKENTAADSNDNIVDITYSVSETCFAGFSCDESLRYEISVKSDGKPIIEHYSEFATFSDVTTSISDMFSKSGKVLQIIYRAKDIPVYLDKDIDHVEMQRRKK